MIIVLTMGRSGSSLLMQTLLQLGVNVIGRAFRVNANDQHIDGNPKGYFENGEIYYGGPGTPAFRSALDNDASISACKMDIGHFLSPSQTEQWLEVADKIRVVLVSIRHPVEQAQSEYRGRIHDEKSVLNEFAFTTDFLKNYSLAFNQIAAVADQPVRKYQRRIQIIDYAEAMEDADAYVKRVARCAGIATTVSRQAAAISNIDRALYRTKRDALPREHEDWARKLGALSAYQWLSDLRLKNE